MLVSVISDMSDITKIIEYSSENIAAKKEDGWETQRKWSIYWSMVVWQRFVAFLNYSFEYISDR